MSDIVTDPPFRGIMNAGSNFKWRDSQDDFSLVKPN
jgi:hypothetical protein